MHQQRQESSSGADADGGPPSSAASEAANPEWEDQLARQCDWIQLSLAGNLRDFPLLSRATRQQVGGAAPPPHPACTAGTAQAACGEGDRRPLSTLYRLCRQWPMEEVIWAQAPILPATRRLGADGHGCQGLLTLNPGLWCLHVGLLLVKQVRGEDVKTMDNTSVAYAGQPSETVSLLCCRGEGRLSWEDQQQCWEDQQ